MRTFITALGTAILGGVISPIFAAATSSYHLAYACSAQHAVSLIGGVSESKKKLSCLLAVVLTSSRA
jgi:hypothetical protein